MNKVFVKAILSSKVLPTFSGIVISGFGKNDVFPKTDVIEIDEIIIDKVKFRHVIAKIDHETTSAIIPFAQAKQDVHKYMRGVDHELESDYYDYISEITKTYPHELLKNIKIKKEDKDALEKKLNTIGNKIYEDFIKNINKYQDIKYESRVMRSVSLLPKIELAVMAETLVNLASFTRKMSLEKAETVGEPIDVALISKGDGFVWIKRKHYFEKSLNPNYISSASMIGDNHE